MQNEPARDFAQPSVRHAFAWTVAAVSAPAVPEASDPEEARQAITKAAAAFPAWRDLDRLARARVIVQAAALLRDRRDELAAIMIHEAGKPWREADADVCEAIDFCEYYARGAVGLSGVGSKAGGPDYLRHFVEPRSASENTMRHGFAPEME
jgi:delta 1-pyrroline-5-carboxylate dehydrogenase